MKQSALVMLVGAMSMLLAQSACAAEEELRVAPVMNNSPASQAGRPADMFEDADTDGDGVLSKQEFIGRAEAHFKEMDMDADGLVTADEMHALSDKKRLEMRQYMKQQQHAQPVPSAPQKK